MEHNKSPLLYPVLDNRPIDQWKVTELKEELKRRKLTVKGLKEELIKRLDEALRDEIEAASGNVDDVSVGIPHTEVESEVVDTVLVGAETSGDVIDNGDNRTGVAGGTVQVRTDDTVSSLGEGEFQDMEVTGSTDSAGKEKQSIHATSVETSITTSNILVSEIALSAQVSNLEPQLENVGPKSSHEDVKFKSSDTNNQVSEVNPDLGLQVKSDLISPVSVSINEKNELKDNLIADSVTLELETEPEMEKPSPNNVDFDGGELHPMDVEEPLKDMVSIEGRDDDYAENADISKKDGYAENGSSEKSNVDQIFVDGYMEENALERETIDYPGEVGESGEKTEVPVVEEDDPVDIVGDDTPANKNGENDNVFATPTVERNLHGYMEENSLESNTTDFSDEVRERCEETEILVVKDDPIEIAEDVIPVNKQEIHDKNENGYMEENALESNTIDFPDEVQDRGERTEVPMVNEDDPVDIVGDDTPAYEKDIHDKSEKGLVSPSVKRKPHDQGGFGKVETSKRQRRWSSESLKVTEAQTVTLPSSTTPKDTLPSNALRRNLARSDSTASEDAPKEHVVPPSPRPPTNSLRIDRFLRPFTLKAVQELLGKTGTFTSFWMDQIKTHCYVTYSSVDEAIETRNAVYNLQWPPNGGHLLVAEFVDPQEVKMRVDAPHSLSTPVNAGTKIPPAAPTLLTRPSPRQHVPRQQLPPPPPTLQTQPSPGQRRQLPPPPPTVQPQPSSRQHVERQQLPLPPPPPLSNSPQAREQLTLPPPPPLPDKVVPSVLTLDDLFRKTKAPPRIYYLPLSDEQVAAKLKALGQNGQQ